MYCTPQIHELELRNNLGRADQAARGCQAGEGLCFAAGPHRPLFSRLRTTLLWGQTENGPADHIARSGVLAMQLTSLRTKSSRLALSPDPGPRLGSHPRRNWNQLSGPSYLVYYTSLLL